MGGGGDGGGGVGGGGVGGGGDGGGDKGGGGDGGGIIGGGGVGGGGVGGGGIGGGGDGGGDKGGGGAGGGGDGGGKTGGGGVGGGGDGGGGKDGGRFATNVVMCACCTTSPPCFRHNTYDPTSRVAVIDMLASSAPPDQTKGGSDGQLVPTGTQNATSFSVNTWLPVNVITTGSPCQIEM